ncbi:helix-turn-helix transcriptional regulator [Microvirga yunnanensis]|uniref:helix-turn-helix transcriptional regulator n=1 Tax=Microvirga yunnanensis TaxID=2953740 RepID=UPI0021C7AC1B|nr:helix-turn-helix transcriptional regulator [Microvirga sp. HBU65207]
MTRAGAGTGPVDLRRSKQAGATNAADRVQRAAQNGLSDQAPDRTQLEQIIAGLTEGVILIGPDQTITYANEAALEMHGVQTLDELGRTVDEYRKNFVVRHHCSDILHLGHYPIDRVVAGEAFEDMVVVVAHTSNQDRDRTHRIRSLVITDHAGNPDCLVLIVHDVSGQIEAEHRFERAFAANPAPAIICRLTDLRFVKVNDGFLELTGYKREDVLGRTVYEIDVLERAERRNLALERLRAGETIPQMEACLTVPSDPGGRQVVAAGQPIEVGEEPCMLFTFADLEPRRKAETALRRSEERFAKAFCLAPVPTTISTADDHRLIEINEAFSRVLGYRAQDVVGYSAEDIGLWIDDEERRRFEGELTKTGSVRDFEALLRVKGGSEINCLVSAEAITLGDRTCILCSFQDITARRRSEEELVKAIEAVMADASWFSRGVVEKLAALRHPPRPGQSPAQVAASVADLTPREREVLTLVCQGKSDSEIGTELKLARNTVRNHVASLYQKLGVNRRSALVVWARERGIGAEGVEAKLPKAPKRGAGKPGQVVRKNHFKN